jgi:hypothetical protein
MLVPNTYDESRIRLDKLQVSHLLQKLFSYIMTGSQKLYTVKPALVTTSIQQ